MASISRHLLFQSVLGHMALLAEKHPDKAESPVARRAKLSIESSLRLSRKRGRRAA
jgi:hypothetical protein